MGLRFSLRDGGMNRHGAASALMESNEVCFRKAAPKNVSFEEILLESGDIGWAGGLATFHVQEKQLQFFACDELRNPLHILVKISHLLPATG